MGEPVKPEVWKMSPPSANDSSATPGFFASLPPHPGDSILNHPDQLLEELHKVPVFQSLTADQLSCFDTAQYFEIPAGTLMIPQNGNERGYVVMFEGGTRISQVQPDGREVTIANTPGYTSFGEVPILTNRPNFASLVTTSLCKLIFLNEDGFWKLMITCPMVRQAILGAMAWRSQRMQDFTLQQEKLASLGVLAAGLMHELNNPGAAAKRAASQLRENLIRLQELSLRLSQHDEPEKTPGKKRCIAELQEQALANRKPVLMNSLDQSDAEEALSTWLAANKIDNAWKLAPTLVGIGLDKQQLECAHGEFQGGEFSDVLNWLEALVSSVQLVGTIEESIGRVSELIHAVKSYAYEGKGSIKNVDVNESLHSTLVILGHKLREKQIEVEKDFATDLPTIRTAGTGLNQVWTNLLDNAADAAEPHGKINIRTWEEGAEVCVSIADNGAGIPQECQAHIFEPFYTTKEVGVGTGLGLDIAHRIVAQQYAGHISFTSAPGRTEFLIRLPKERA